MYYCCTIRGVGVCEIGEDGEDVESELQSLSVPGVGVLERREEEGQTGDSGEMVITATSTKRSRVKVCSSLTYTMLCSSIKNNTDM